MTSPPNKPIRLRLTAAAEAAVRQGHPWVFSESIREQNRAGEAGDLAVIYDRHDRFQAIGLWDPASPIRVRILHAGRPVSLDSAWWKQRLEEAISRRDGLFDSSTTGFRWIYGESDGWPGLVLDAYDTTLVLKLYTAAWLPRVGELTELLATRLRPTRIVLRLSRNIAAAAQRADLRDGQNLFGSDTSERVVFLESGLRFESEVALGQKTGFFLDQRENRRRIEQEANGAEILNAFSFSGGFSLYAARGGAQSATDLDISPHALNQARRNFALNADLPAVRRARHESVVGDAFAWLASAHRSFDIVILDPPSFAKREAERTAAVDAYARLARLGIRRVRGGGLLLACSCSAHVSADEFFDAVRRAARSERRSFQEVGATGHPPDHAATFAEAQYLKAIYLRIGGSVPDLGRL